MSTPVGLPKRLLEFILDGSAVKVPEGTTILDAAKSCNVEPEIPTLCFGDTITPKNACRVCMVEVEGSRTLVPSCSRKVEAGMVVRTHTDRTDHSRKLVLELLGSSVDLSLTKNVDRWNGEYGAAPERFDVGGIPAESVAQPVKVDNDLYVRDYSKCILCYQCVDACGEQFQNTFAISVAGRGFFSRISAEFDAALPDSACVYCGNCIQVCPNVERVGADADRHDLPVLRRRLRGHVARSGQLDREGHLAVGPLGDRGQPLHQRSVRLPTRAKPLTRTVLSVRC
jgi:predicted molibdopterin-dependent oxidoreductase YjgC